MRKLLFIPLWLLAKGVLSQDSLTADYINTIVDRIENRLAMAILERKDTVIYDKEDTSKIGEALKIRTEFYTDPRSNQIEKITERSRYKSWTTELTVYYQVGKPVRFTSMQWNGVKVIVDFDVYYMNDQSVFFVKRNKAKGEPDCDEFLKWCYELLKSYKKNFGTVVQRE